MRRAELLGVADAELLARLRPLPRNSEERAVICEILVERYTGLVRSCVRRYRGSPVPAEDLMQVGYVGLLKAITTSTPPPGKACPPTPGPASAARSSGISATSAGRYAWAGTRRNYSWRCVRRTKR